MRILAISDLHTDFRENKVLLEQLSGETYQRDILIAAGDISDRIETLKSTLTLLPPKFMKVFYVPGNHNCGCAGATARRLRSFSTCSRYARR